MTAIAATNPTQSTFSLPTMVAPQIMPNAKALDKVAALPPPPKMSAGMTQEAAKAIASFTGGWSKGGGNQSGQPLKKRQFEFTAYLAKYSGGDWDSTIKYKDGKVFSGSLPNLLYVISKISADKIKAMAEPIPLDLSNWDEIIAKKPPFIFFTGHRDFVLTDKEIENLQKYLRMGGCIWGDSSLPGLRSRFDLAFRREMRRIVPDVDKNFEPLPPDHPVFTKTYFTEIKSIPPGINYYKEPIYALKVYGEVAIIYTANDYGDMWQIGLNEKGEIDERRDAQGNFVAFNPSILWNSDIYFRNISPSSLLASYKFGTNMIVHLMTRWEDKVRNVR